jgi:hypothetical protein
MKTPLPSIFYILILLILGTPIAAFASDSFSITRALGTTGELGQDSLVLMCVKKKCQITSLKNDVVLAKKALSRKDADTYFYNAQKAMKLTAAHEEKTDAPKSANIELVFDRKKSKADAFNADLLQLEAKLRARLRS